MKEVFFYAKVLVLLYVCGEFIVKCQLSNCPDYAVTYHQSCYIFGFGKSMHYHDAETFCQAHYAGHVVHVDTKDEGAFLKTYMSRLPRSENYWIGMTDEVTEHVWRWSDSGTSVSYFDWAPGDPDNVPVDEDCAVFWTSAGYKWADVPCGTFKAEPVCEINSADETDIVG